MVCVVCVVEGETAVAWGAEILEDEDADFGWEVQEGKDRAVSDSIVSFSGTISKIGHELCENL